MNFKTLRPLVGTLVFASLAHSAIAETLGEHPAVIVARTWSTREIDPNTLIMLHPANPRFRWCFQLKRQGHPRTSTAPRTP